MPKKTFNDRMLRTLKPASAGQRYEIMDVVVPGLGVRVTDRGRRTFVFLKRYPGHTNPARRTLGVYGALSLEKARQKARLWDELIGRGIDPHDEEERQRRDEQVKRTNTFAAVAGDFFRDKLPSERKGREVERDIRRELIPPWGHRPIGDITDADVAALVKAKARTAPAQARNLLGYAKRMVRWAYEQRAYGLASSQVSAIVQLRPQSLIGEKSLRNRVLTDDEIFALWRAARRLGYPYGPVYQLLMLTGLRLNEVADASWPEFRFRDGLWEIPAARMKAKNSRARAHQVPLISEIVKIVEKLPRFERGKFIFSTTFGQKPAWITSKVKERLDHRMLQTLRALARTRGDPTDIELNPWTNHDIRRSCRTRLSRLKISEEAREAVLAHVRPGIKGAYDAHDYFEEKKEALELWAARLRSIVEPAPANVVNLARVRV